MNKNNSGSLSTLTNLGNTCYINSIIQILRHTSCLNNLLDNKEDLINTIESNEITEYDISSNKYLLVINHYPYQSKNFWQTVKIARGNDGRQRTQPEWDEAEKKANKKLDTCLCDIKYTS